MSKHYYKVLYYDGKTTRLVFIRATTLVDARVAFYRGISRGHGETVRDVERVPAKYVPRLNQPIEPRTYKMFIDEVDSFAWQKKGHPLTEPKEIVRLIKRGR